MITKLGFYKRYSKENLIFEEKLLDKYPPLKGLLKSRKHSADIFSRYILHFSLWYHIFFKDKKE